MARITSLSILLEQEGKDFLSELYGKVIENLQKELVSFKLKNKDLSGEPGSGSYEAKRFCNAKSKAYGTARAAGKGDNLKARPVTVKVNVDREIVEEIEKKDIKLYGVDGLLERRSANHVLTMAAELDEAFFTQAATDATEVEVDPALPVQEQFEKVIQACESTKNEYVNGVPRKYINLICGPEYYGKIRNHLDTITRATIDSGEEEIKVWHGVKVDDTVNLPNGVPYIVMVDGSIAQPVESDTYAAEKIGLSNAMGVSLFYSYGTTTVTPDLIYKPVAPETEETPVVDPDPLDGQE